MREVATRGGSPVIIAKHLTSEPSSTTVVRNVRLIRSVDWRTSRSPRRPSTVSDTDSDMSTDRISAEAAALGLAGDDDDDEMPDAIWTLTTGVGWPPTAMQRRVPRWPST